MKHFRRSALVVLVVGATAVLGLVSVAHADPVKNSRVDQDAAMASCAARQGTYTETRKPGRACFSNTSRSVSLRVNLRGARSTQTKEMCSTSLTTVISWVRLLDR